MSDLPTSKGGKNLTFTEAGISLSRVKQIIEMSGEIDKSGTNEDSYSESFQSTNIHDNEHGGGEHSERTEEEYGQTQLTLRAIVSMKEAGVVIGKAGKNVADLREETGVKAGVSKVVPNVHDRVLTMTGTLDGVSRAYGMVTQTLLDSPPMPISGPPTSPGSHRRSS